MFSSAPGWNAGTKNGKPWMWSQCVWPMKRWSRIGGDSVRERCRPSSRAPVPQSRTITVPSEARTSTQEVLPPYAAVFGPGGGIDTPELGRPGARAAASRLAELLREGPVTIMPRAEDVYGRTVADVYVGGRNVADVLRREGFGKPGGRCSRPARCLESVSE